MSDLDYLLVVFLLGLFIYMARTLRHAWKRLHYRDRPTFWKSLLPLGLPAALGIWILVKTFQGDVTLLWQLVAAGVACALAGLVWWIDLNPSRFMRTVATRR